MKTTRKASFIADADMRTTDDNYAALSGGPEAKKDESSCQINLTKSTCAWLYKTIPWLCKSEIIDENQRKLNEQHRTNGVDHLVYEPLCADKPGWRRLGSFGLILFSPVAVTAALLGDGLASLGRCMCKGCCCCGDKKQDETASATYQP